jgi:phenylalanyl-tRNA synthetase beta chain
MRISLEWLQQYVRCTLPPQELASRLTMVGLEVEGVDDLGAPYAKFVVGKVLSVTKHPRADRLTVCQVEVGGATPVQIVCGAPNVKEGQKVPVGLVGATVLRNQHDPDGKPFVLSSVKLRGEDSLGMICSPYELAVGEERDGIMVLRDDALVGLPLAEYLGLNDVALEIGITPNRPDAMCHIGIAREVGALLNHPLRIPAVRVVEGKREIRNHASVTIEDAIGCARYTARAVFGISIGPSPGWMQRRLSAVGVRPVNNVVDVTNYVLMECGHPLHAFDYDLLAGHAIIVRRARQGEPFITLDHKERSLGAETLMICDATRPVAIAGVMGGANSEINTDTVNIIIESAYFDPRSIRRSSKRLALSTEASQRFERGADPNLTSWAVDRAAQLIRETAGGEVLKGRVDVYPKKIRARSIKLRVEHAAELLGVPLRASTVRSLLERIGIKTLNQKGGIGCTIPTFRPDLEREIDLIEEVARTYGYEKILTERRARVHLPETVPSPETDGMLRATLIGRGFNEVVSNSMQERSVALIASDTPVEILNPISKEMAALRTSLIPGLLMIVRNNIFRGNKDLRLFEFGKQYSSSGNGYREQERLLLLATGFASPLHWDEKRRLVDIFDIEGEVGHLLAKIFLDKINFIPYSTTNALTESDLRVENQGESIGFVGAVREELRRRFEIDQEVVVAELDLPKIARGVGTHRKFHELPRYPAVMRDIAVIIDEEIPVGSVRRVIEESGTLLLRSLELFDIFSGDQVGPGKKSCAFALEFMSLEHTLSQEEVEQLMRNIIAHLSEQLNASIRN